MIAPTGSLRKLSQVGTIRTIATLFRDWLIDPVTNPGETLQVARERILNFIREDTGMVLLVQLLHLERCPLVWKGR